MCTDLTRNTQAAHRDTLQRHRRHHLRSIEQEIHGDAATLTGSMTRTRVEADENSEEERLSVGDFGAHKKCKSGQQEHRRKGEVREHLRVTLLHRFISREGLETRTLMIVAKHCPPSRPLMKSTSRLCWHLASGARQESTRTYRYRCNDVFLRAAIWSDIDWSGPGRSPPHFASLHWRPRRI